MPRSCKARAASDICFGSEPAIWTEISPGLFEKSNRCWLLLVCQSLGSEMTISPVASAAPYWCEIDRHGRSLTPAMGASNTFPLM